jgi:hypothetical protein
MLEALIHKLHTYLIENNPDLLLDLQEENRLTAYLQDKVKSVEQTLWQLQDSEAPQYIMEEILMDMLTEDLKPSRFNYVCSILQEVLPDKFEQLQEGGTLTYEGVNLVAECRSIFDSSGFSAATEASPVLHQVVADIIRQYFQKQ